MFILKGGELITIEVCDFKFCQAYIYLYFGFVFDGFSQINWIWNSPFTSILNCNTFTNVSWNVDTNASYK